jgi:(E)-4-hydroxy-3-methylbut-2-enyl-diphosphate synthase
MQTRYCTNFTRYQRHETGEVIIGGIPLGADHPIRIQSMTNTLTADSEATASQIIRIRDAGADYVRVTVPGRKDVESLKEILASLERRNCKVPVIADIHFNPALAILSAAIVHKVRINPGNFIDKKLFKTIDYSVEEYKQELDRLEVRFLELLGICRENKTALRIGTNHGSLSDRIMNRYGDTPEGMAESAMEFLRICKKENFRDVVVSMKSSNTRIMVFATRLLVDKMEQEGMHFPLHLGVTEAGEGEDGRIKSAVGIGALLADGLGDTIRVSLTEDPEKEIPVAKKIADYVTGWENHPEISDFGELPVDPFNHVRRTSAQAGIVGDYQVPVVLSDLPEVNSPLDLEPLGWRYRTDGTWEFDELVPDILFTPVWPKGMPCPPDKYILTDSEKLSLPNQNNNVIQLYKWDSYARLSGINGRITGVELQAKEVDEKKIELLKNRKNTFIILDTQNVNGFADMRSAVFRLMNMQCRVPVIFRRSFQENEKENLQLKSAIDFGGLFIDGLGDGIWIENEGKIKNKELIETAFNILQASRVRVSRTEYISCPSCGRTLFDLQATTKKIREKTSHLKGLKIGIMGCIVNGPGEMADANYGYVGTGQGKVTLYKEKEVIRRNIPEEQAVDELINLIKENGDWIEPNSTSA